ncbi:MAG: serine/threonine-protein kinase [Vicinamibacteria bacterium]|nr:serine/threonine-protein kinase [Vicinamibacteria bacterium]
MSTPTGSRIGPYEIGAPIGAGGMGEVLRARDTKLGREVALKVLPAAFAQDAERVARFRREAQILASLNHANIAAIYGLEESEGVLALVMELVEGEDLAARLKLGAIPVDEAIAIAEQIAEALEEAHEKGIVHRDLKPANVKVTSDGKVKVLDFGLAKAFSADPMSSSGSHDLSQSPTLATAAGTQAGVILGTAAYMSPEQARGKVVDRRADIWAFGVVLFEMLTGRRLFAGETVSDTLAAVLTREVDWRALPAKTPSAVVRLLHRCLERDARQRLQAIGEARIALSAPAADAAATPRRAWTGLVAAVAILGVGLAFAAGRGFAPRTSTVRLHKVDLVAPDLQVRLGRTPTISPDGRRIAYTSEDRLWVRELDDLEPREVAGSAAHFFTWSPDSRNLAYLRDGRAWRVAATGGAPTDLGTVPPDLSGSGGGVWTLDDRLLFAGSDKVGLLEIPAAGGTARDVLPLDRARESDLHEISALPDGRGLVFPVHVLGGLPSQIDVLVGGKRKTVLELPGESLRSPVYASTGHLLYERQTTSPGLWAVPFSLDRLETTGAPFLVAANASAPTLAADGTLCHVRNDVGGIEIVKVSRQGVVETSIPLSGFRSAAMAQTPEGSGYRIEGGLRFSPDGQRLAVSIGVSPGTLSVYDLARANLTAVATQTFPRPPVWTPAGDRLIYPSARESVRWNLWWRRADASDAEQRLTRSEEVQVPVALTADGRTLLFTEGSGPAGRLRAMDLTPGAASRPAFVDAAGALAGSFSPDGRFVAYDTKDERSEVYVRPFPAADTRLQVSNEGGEAPVWTRSGEILFLAGNRLVAARVTVRDGRPVADRPQSLFSLEQVPGLAPVFDVSPADGSIFMLRRKGRSNIALVFDWPAELARLQSRDSEKVRP